MIHLVLSPQSCLLQSPSAELNSTKRLHDAARYRSLTIWSTNSKRELTASTATLRRSRIREQNEARIIEAALHVFSTIGYRGATVEEIAQCAGMSKANVLYYFKRKQDIYAAVLAQTLDVWLDPLQELNPSGDPIDEIWQYARQKLRLSFEAPQASRLFANEILQGAPVIRTFLQNQLRIQVNSKCQLIQKWIDQGRLAPVHPLHLIFLIWSSTQHYADFETQIDALTTSENRERLEQAEATLKLILIRGLQPDT
ncbi:MAG: TetR family transcriptional regulator C-terminal domain-containing protein [Granulosicoccus sp.]|nr:TetR family transcriptional regulator C-terminal domain-containing protein [Granulosicoccus sp.]